MMTRYYIGLLLTAAVMCTSCEKELDFHYHDVEPQLVIEGNLTADGARVALTSTTPMDEAMNRHKITDASVRLTDMTAGTTVSLSPDADGVFTDALGGIEGHEYRLDVSAGGRSYSSVSTMGPSTDILALEFRWIKMPYDYVALLQVTFTDSPGVDDCYWVRLYRNGEAYLWSVLDDCHAVNGLIHEVIMTSRKDVDEEDDNMVLRDGDVVTVSVTAVSREMFDYLVALQSDSNGPRMFAGDFCLGYFLASPVGRSDIVYHPDQMEEVE